MAVCTPIYLTSIGFFFPRSYLTRVLVVDDGATNVHWSGENVIYTWSGVYTIIAAMHHNVYEWSSNVYSIQYVWDEDNCRAILGGVDQDFALYEWMTYDPDGHDMVLKIKVQPVEGTPIPLSLPPAPSGYWFPYN